MNDKNMPYEELVRKICGGQWRNLPPKEQNAGWGIAIVNSILDGVKPDLYNMSSHLGVERHQILFAYKNLSMNGVFLGGKVEKERKVLEAKDMPSDTMLAWGYYGGLASAATGTHESDKDKLLVSKR